MQHAEVWLINLSPTLGAEMQKTRPAVVVNMAQIAQALKVVLKLGS